MNALADDQMDRLRDLLAGSGVTFAIYTGATPSKKADVPSIRLAAGSSRADYRAELLRQRDEAGEAKRPRVVHPAEEIVSREELRRAGGQPRILLTNVKQLESLLTRQQDIELFDGATLDYLVFDEAHTFRGALGAETACLIRRLRAFCGRTPEQTVCIGTSATLVDSGNAASSVAGREFAARFFGVDRQRCSWWASATNRRKSGAPAARCPLPWRTRRGNCRRCWKWWRWKNPARACEIFTPA